MKLIVSNTGPILHLREAKLLNLLQKADHVYIPQKVDDELIKLDSRWKKDRPLWIEIEPLKSNEAKDAEYLFLSGLLDLGEAEAIILAKRLQPNWFLTDETEARILDSSLGIEVHGSLGVVLWSASVGHLNYKESKEALDRLSTTSLWISKNILSEAQKAIEIIFGI
jgi:predicted nucleic acid-binding protein